MNQVTECHQVLGLAEIVARLTQSEIARLVNPRQEAETNDLAVVNRSLLSYGLNPTTLDEGLLREISDIALKYKDRADLSKIPCASAWNAERAAALATQGGARAADDAP